MATSSMEKPCKWSHRLKKVPHWPYWLMPHPVIPCEGLCTGKATIALVSCLLPLR